MAAHLKDEKYFEENFREATSEMANNWFIRLHGVIEMLRKTFIGDKIP